MDEIEMELDVDFKKATVISSQKELPVTSNGRYKKFILPGLNDYEVVVLE